MRYAAKKPSICQAWPLGAGSEMEQKLTMLRVIRRLPRGMYMLFSRECHTEQGEIAAAGDYFKAEQDESGRWYAWPMAREWFLSNHEPVPNEADTYRQISTPRKVWMAGDAMCEEIQFLLQSGQLQLCPESETAYFKSGAMTAAKNAVLVIYEEAKTPAGQLEQINFAFVARDVFEQSYRML